MTIKKFIRILGPGLLYAGAAVGVSHLVQSTRAGASYGFDLVWILLIANILKYPFFEFAPRYATATGKSLIDGYRVIGKWAVILYAILTVATMFSFQAAVTIVTAGLVANIFGISLDNISLCAILLGTIMVVLIVGRYSVLDKLIKIVIVILTITTVSGLIYALNIGYTPNMDIAKSFNWHDNIDILFVIAFIGWMPAPIDLSVWHSLWSIAKKKQLGYSPKMKESLLDFNVGYIGSAFLALCFLSLGAFVMYGTGEELSHNGVDFAGQLIQLYTSSLGDWSYYIIAIAALATMVSTTLTCLDGYPRVLKLTTEILFPVKNKVNKNSNRLYWLWMIVVVAGTLILMSLFAKGMRFMVDLATTIAFITAPFFALMNYKVINDKHVPKEARPKLWLKVYGWIGILFLGAFSLFFIIWKIF